MGRTAKVGTEVAARRIAIVGTGANGASIGADLTLAGEEVVFIEQWPAHVEAMRANGVTINAPGPNADGPRPNGPSLRVATRRETFDVVLLLVCQLGERRLVQRSRQGRPLRRLEEPELFTHEVRAAFRSIR